MSSTTELIVAALRTDLLKIKPENSYTNKIVEVKSGPVILSKDQKVPAIGFILGRETNEPLTRGQNLGVTTLPVLMDVIFRSSADPGKLTDLQETLIEDVKKHFRKDSAVQSASWSSIYGIIAAAGAKGGVYVREVGRALDFNEHKGRIVFLINIKYMEKI